MHRTLATLLLATVCASSWAQDWFTVYGDPLQPEADLIEIRLPSPSQADHLAVEVRVSRSATRVAYGGGKYRSHHSMAVIDCENQAGWYTQMKFYQLPAWKGPMTMSRSFELGSAPVAFKDIPGEAQRLVRAACRLRK
ncbi:hypothetical protein [Comamonas antarctica]|uniref:hypothetical protein n=1 Tax=Comamonas antarctica TaxID=2743470 RepID=UPI0028EA470F|nr:hypothetical protein [Comamonas antarctica]